MPVEDGGHRAAGGGAAGGRPTAGGNGGSVEAGGSSGGARGLDAAMGGRSDAARVDGSGNAGGGARDSGTRDSSVDGPVRGDGGLRDARTTGDALPSDAGNDPCRDPTGTACDGNILRMCIGGESVDTDCATYFLAGTPPVATECRRFAEGSRCTSLVGNPCFTDREGIFASFRCAGAESGCVSLGGGNSECVEHLGWCDPRGPLHRCAGEVDLTVC